MCGASCSIVDSRALACTLQVIGSGLVWPAIVAATGVSSYYALRYGAVVNALLGGGFATSILLSLVGLLAIPPPLRL